TCVPSITRLDTHRKHQEETVSLVVQVGLTLLLAVFIATGHTVESLQCTKEEKFRNGGSRGVNLTLQIDKQEVVSIAHINTIASGKEGGAYACQLDASRSDGKSTWSRKGHTTRAVLGDEEEESTFVILQSGADYDVLFVSMRSSYCGFGAEFPER